jgi:hypothetical protein
MRTVKTESAAEIVELLRGRVGYRRRANALARQLGVSHSYLSEVLAGKKLPGPKLLDALGFDPAPRYARKSKSPD